MQRIGAAVWFYARHGTTLPADQASVEKAIEYYYIQYHASWTDWTTSRPRRGHRLPPGAFVISAKATPAELAHKQS